MACTPSGIGCSSTPGGCPAIDGCIPGVCPDFTIRRHDTKPPLKIKIDDCDGPLDLTGLVLEASMWAKAKLKSSITSIDTSLSLADNIGFGQIMVGDVIYMDRARSPEKMLVTAFDEANSLVYVQRGYHATAPQSWKRGTPFRIFKFSNAVAHTEMLLQDIIQIDGTTKTNVLTDSFLIYEWGTTDTCLPGCYYLEFKLLKMSDHSHPDPTPSLISGCGLGAGVEWVRRFPLEEGFLIKITDSPTAE